MSNYIPLYTNSITEARAQGELDLWRESYLVKYISTRDGVRTVHDADLHLAPTKKQKEYIQELTKLFPEAKQLAEYETYRLSPSQHSAAELIEQIEETFASELNKRENFVAYIAKRPGVRRIGSHGLWNADGQIPVMQTVIDEVAQHKGNVWTPIISLPREDAERLLS